MALCLSLRADLALEGRWEPQGENRAARVLSVDGRRVLEFTCGFKKTQLTRGCWDRSGRLDMTTARGLQFRFRCLDRESISSFMLYLHSGAGWYLATFDEEQAGEWNTVTIEKSEMKSEGRPGGWGEVDKIRIAAWRGGDRDASFQVSDLRVLGGDGSILVVRGDSAADGDAAQGQALMRYAQTVADSLDALGLSYGFISDHDLGEAQLGKARVVILAYSPSLPGPALRALRAYLKRGGKLICFYILPADLAAQVGIRGGDHLRPQQPGQFASIRPSNKNPLDLPAVAQQNSWNIYTAQPIAGKSVTAAYWHDSAGQKTPYPAVISSPNCVLMTHVLIDDDPLQKQELLLAMVGKFDPRAWQLAAQAGVENIGAFGPYANTEAALRGLHRASENHALAGAAFREAEDLRVKAQAMLKAKRFGSARELSGGARRALIRAYCAIQPARAGEMRAFWCHSAFGVQGMTWDAAVKNLADNGFTALLPNMAWGGVAYYPSKVLPVAREVAQQGDQVAACAAACRKYGVACHVWKVCWKMGSTTHPGFVKRMKQEQRIQVSRGGVASGKWLCPSHPKNRQLEIAALLELVQNYDISGVHLDYIRYPGQSHCFCKGCRKRFELKLGTAVASWPKDVEQGGRHATAWLAFRQGNITAVVREVSAQARKLKPGIQVSAAVFPNYATDRASVAQDWKLWCEKGYLDFVCPMDYTPSTSAFEQKVKRQLNWAGKVPLYPGIGLSTWSRAGDVCRLIDQVKAARRLGAQGFTVFEYGAAEARDVVPLCGLGLTRNSGQ